MISTGLDLLLSKPSNREKPARDLVADLSFRLSPRAEETSLPISELNVYSASEFETTRSDLIILPSLKTTPSTLFRSTSIFVTNDLN